MSMRIVAREASLMTPQDAWQRALALVQAEYAAAQKGADELSRVVTERNIWDWAARGYAAALRQLEQNPPAAGETVEEYLLRAHDCIRERSGYEPDEDDIGMYEGSV